MKQSAFLRPIEISFAVLIVMVAALVFRWAWGVLDTAFPSKWNWDAMAAIGTSAAVIVALWTAQTADREKRRHARIQAQVTAMRLIRPLSHIRVELWVGINSLNLYIADAVDFYSAMTSLTRIEKLSFAYSFDELARLAPVEPELAEKLHEFEFVFGLVGIGFSHLHTKLQQVQIMEQSVDHPRIVRDAKEAAKSLREHLNVLVDLGAKVEELCHNCASPLLRRA